MRGTDDHSLRDINLVAARRTLVCATHGAIYEPDTGRCIGGPCVGDRLERLDVRREGDTIVVTWPG